MKLEYAGKSVRPLRVASEHCHLHWELVYNETGCGVMRINGRSYEFEPGSIMLYPPQVVHYKAAQGQFEDYYVLFSGCDLPHDIYCFRTGQGETILQLMKILYSCYHETKQLSVCTSLMSAIMELLMQGEADMDKNVLQLRRILAERFTDADFRISDAVAQIHLNEDHLRRCFKKELEMTPQDYLTRLRVENAKKLLVQTGGNGMRIAEAAYLSGFYDPLYFSRVFRKYTGLSPREWRERTRIDS